MAVVVNARRIVLVIYAIFFGRGVVGCVIVCGILLLLRTKDRKKL